MLERVGSRRAAYQQEVMAAALQHLDIYAKAIAGGPTGLIASVGYRNKEADYS
jgi:hypothetical protein